MSYAHTRPDRPSAHVVERARHLLDTLESHAKSGEPLDIQHEFQKLTFDIIGAYRPGLAIVCVCVCVCVPVLTLCFKGTSR